MFSLELLVFFPMWNAKYGIILRLDVQLERVFQDNLFAITYLILDVVIG